MTTPVRGLGDLPVIGPAAITMGAFDGVHLGHVALLEATRDAAARLGVASVALVFDPHPDEVLRPGTRVARLAPLAENLRRIDEIGIDHAIPIRFDEALRQRTAEQFLEALAPSVRLKAVVMSEESAFGRGRTGTVAYLREVGRGAGFEMVPVTRVALAGAPISSSRLRDAVTAGDIATARAMGRAPYIEGTVVHGDGRGRDLGYPTANLAIDYPVAMPPQGVYAGSAVLSGAGSRETAPSLVSIGTRPTFSSNGAELVEVHLLDRDLDLYGQVIGVELLQLLRGQVRFDDVADLVSQMQRDEADARAALAGR